MKARAHRLQACVCVIALTECSRHAQHVRTFFPGWAAYCFQFILCACVLPSLSAAGCAHSLHLAHEVHEPTQRRRP